MLMLISVNVNIFYFNVDTIYQSLESVDPPYQIVLANTLASQSISSNLGPSNFKKTR